VNEQEQKATVQEYVCGFMFDRDMDYVVLVRKAKPLWQKGKLNGVGGKVEVKETVKAVPGLTNGFHIYEKPTEAMAREFKEETGYTTKPEDWRLFRTERFGLAASNVSDAKSGAIVHFLFAINSWAVRDARTMESEVIEKHNVRMALSLINRAELMYNIPYLIEMAMALAVAPDENWPAP
jgi:8-oxo-dGTP diphosphatase